MRAVGAEGDAGDGGSVPAAMLAQDGHQVLGLPGELLHLGDLLGVKAIESRRQLPEEVAGALRDRSAGQAPSDAQDLRAKLVPIAGDVFDAVGKPLEDHVEVDDLGILIRAAHPGQQDWTKGEQCRQSQAPAFQERRTHGIPRDADGEPPLMPLRHAWLGNKGHTPLYFVVHQLSFVIAKPFRGRYPEAMKTALHSVSYAGVWPGQARLGLDQFLARAHDLGFGAVMLMAKRPHLSPLDHDADARRRCARPAGKSGD